MVVDRCMLIFGGNAKALENKLNLPKELSGP